jgi:2-dehydro-3-deoxyphosphogluconate aldolase/(4S)-4-hydroxy-2-oxoglutarate aldolase
MNPSTVIETLYSHRATAILRTDDTDVARAAMEAAVAGGFRAIEFTLTIPGALDLIASFAARPGLVVGAGTVLRVEQAREAVRAGASFLVSPVVDVGVIEEAAALGAVAMPGAHTPTELLLAHDAGAPLQKLFPAPAGGPSYLRAVLGPLPFLRVVPTSGVTLDNAAEWLEAGAFAVGFVAPLFAPADLAARRFDRVEERARAMLAAVHGARRP